MNMQFPDPGSYRARNGAGKICLGLLVVQTNRRPLSNDEDYARRDWLPDARDHADAFTTIDA